MLWLVSWRRSQSISNATHAPAQGPTRIELLEEEGNAPSASRERTTEAKRSVLAGKRAN